MKRLFLLFAAFIALPIFAVVGCNAILGNEPGSIDIDASSSQCGANQKNCGTCVPDDDPKLGCGGACSVCPSPPNAQAGCTLVSGTETCGLGACNAQFADCDTDPSNGCETHTTVRAHCGSCGNDCLQEFCERQGDGYACSATCDPPNQPCTTGTDTECVDTNTDNSNCGSCGNDCAKVANGVGSCQNGNCNTVCNPGFIQCGSQCVAPNDSECEADCHNCGTGSHCEVDPAHVNGQCVINGSCTNANDCNGGTGEECCQGTCHAHGHDCGSTCANCVSQATCTGGSCQCSGTTNPTLCSDPPSNTYWCCGPNDTCGTTVGQCNTVTQCNDPRYNCTLSGGGCGCNNTGSCIANLLNTDTSCGACNTNCTTMDKCCCMNPAGSDAGLGYSCSGTINGGLGEGGPGGCTCTN